ISMALQEYVKDHIFLDDDVLFPYMMHPVVQIGKFQNAFEVVNQPYMDANDIQIVRRVTGGGAIYFDDLIMRFCFLMDGYIDFFGNFARLYYMVMKIIYQFG